MRTKPRLKKGRRRSSKVSLLRLISYFFLFLCFYSSRVDFIVRVELVGFGSPSSESVLILLVMGTAQSPETFPCPIRSRESRSFSEFIRIFDLVTSPKVVARFYSPKEKVGV